MRLLMLFVFLLALLAINAFAQGHPVKCQSCHKVLNPTIVCNPMVTHKRGGNPNTLIAIFRTLNLAKMKKESTERQEGNDPLIASVSGSVYLTENQIAELAQIGSQYLYLGEMEEGRLSYGGVLEILKRYEELRKTDH